MEKQRLDRYISNQLILPRSQVRTGIRRGRATVNGDTVKDPSALIETGADIVYDSVKIEYKKYVYIIMNKPAGVLCATQDKSQKTVIDLVPPSLKRPELAPVGRLDKDTTGLLLITDDGTFAHNCISPKKNVKKCYIADIDAELDESAIAQFKEGITLADGTLCKSADLEIIGQKRVRITITEGKYHQIKRMLGVVGAGVVSLHRESIGALVLPEGLREGECRETNAEFLNKIIGI